MLVPPAPPPAGAPSSLDGSNNNPLDKFDMFVTGNLKNLELLAVFSCDKGIAAEPNVT